MRAWFDRGAAAALTVAVLMACRASLSAQETHLLLVAGLPGQEAYKERFYDWGSTIRAAAVERLSIPAENVTWLADNPAMSPEQIQERATLASMQKAVSDIARHAAADDRVLIVLIGHGTTGSAGARFNLSGPDLSPEALDKMLDAFAPRRVALVHTGSASGEFLPALSGPGRTVITATRSGRESNETWFAGFFAEALAGDSSDLDKDGRISLLEAFRYSRREVQRYFEERNLLATEHALLDGDGDGEGTMEPGDVTEDGLLAGTFYVGGPPLASAAGSGRPSQIEDPVLARLYDEREALEQRVVGHRLRREQMDPAEYERELEEMLVELALKAREIREREGGG